MKTIFITGASAGLGKATAKLFCAKGWKVIATMRSPEKETELNLLDHVHLIAMDVTNEEQVKAAVQEALQLGDIDVVFNNAGYGLIGPMESYTEQQIQQQFDTNVFGVFRVARAFIPYFKSRRQGLLLTTTSICGIASTPLSSVYCASKWALEGWSEGMSYDLAQFGIGIKTIAPGGIKSNYVNVMDVVEDPAYETLNARMMEGFTDGTLMQFTEADNIAATVYEAATDGRDQLRYLAGADAVKTNHKKIKEGHEGYRLGLANYLNLKSPYEKAVAE
jgi:NAD(P)-dependent dehydrogenase (short-subunit alcohol dehydrogenase family)